MSNFKPMLASNVDLDKIVYPILASPKLDGVRAIVIGGRLLSRSLKMIPNAWCQDMFSQLPEGTDGELIFGDPVHPDAYRNTVSAVMSEDGEPTKVTFHIFDNYLVEGGFLTRWTTLKPGKNVEVVPHTFIHSREELDAYESRHVELGHEGVMVRKVDGRYKQGRATTNEALLLKVKRFADAEAVVIGTYAWETNNNTATMNALGRTERSTHKAGKTALDILGGLHVRGLEAPYLNVEFSIGTGFSGADDAGGERAKLWKQRSKLVGQIAKFKYFPLGSLDRPRFPVFLGWRNKIDLGGTHES
jgi:DNA ligase-1